MDVKILHPIEWSDVGVHPTPADIVSEFASATVAELMLVEPKGIAVRVLDACAGDGRLGKAVCKLLHEAGYIPDLTLLDTRENPGSIPADEYVERAITANILSYTTDKFDLVVSNPPYEYLNVERAAELGLEWNSARSGGRNLYGMVMIACLELCKPDGVCSFIAPQGWLRNVLSTELRSAVLAKVSAIRIHAFQSRRLFPRVVQDTAIQVMNIKSPSKLRDTSIRISYDGADEVELYFSVDSQRGGMELPRVRIGPLVWNRHEPTAFVDKGGYRILYGGNISSNGILDWKNRKYSSRRRVKKSSVPKGYVSRAPYIGIKRVMRGGPGAWVADLVAELDPSQECIAENHVIVIELSMNVTQAGVASVIEVLKQQLELRHKDHGHPNLSAGMVRDVVGTIPASEWEK
ncbi:Eco57I restriction-modification methylase domain-containing protein [Xanthomonas campestris pv. campestris]|uniref:Eco57I restriction-modification methylase domain-containing protein n=1 Tax=Xanthomonas campestris TaxID=339 RepID=UPI002377D885|nr:Eco57I restriction-modification methylase domain-containing protein [Xanthomonas campestris]WDK58773.1 Eco57I restriction-modification methylase domain-containing protein [Xanthomonas campestris pv. campestris]WDK62323.1 Eco57I restriction-modification methylase domain-containing protein [Xanthomonas campestris pv. campestris]WDK66361.1 Eco57I restriction-modification methylase domain-containing protein [Xanthomonas campestris pv. campestris]WDK70239.1 Eco57I restriction-modification methyla